MSGSVNKVILLGTLGKDPEVKYTQGGTAVARFSIANDEIWKDQAGEKQQPTTHYPQTSIDRV
jgi:single-strand DNA-binding protein